MNFVERTPHILIVDDQAINVASLRKIVSQDGAVRISAVPNGEEAFAVIERDARK